MIVADRALSRDEESRLYCYDDDVGQRCPSSMGQPRRGRIHPASSAAGLVRVMPIVVRYAPTSLTREQYDKVNESMRENGPGGPPPALQLHVLFGDEPELLVSEMWESEDAWQQAWDGMIKLALSQGRR
jgi:hypothetical protein